MISETSHRTCFVNCDTNKIDIIIYKLDGAIALDNAKIFPNKKLTSHLQSFNNQHFGGSFFLR